jgi:hypothetical protein
MRKKIQEAMTFTVGDSEDHTLRQVPVYEKTKAISDSRCRVQPDTLDLVIQCEDVVIQESRNPNR